MTLLAEEVVEEWLNRQGYFTIRGIKLGVHEIDLLAVRIEDRDLICRHFEVHASIRPVSYLCPLPKSIQRATGRPPKSAKQRTVDELTLSVKEWVKKKYLLEKKHSLRSGLYPGEWSFELVVHNLRHPEELEHIAKEGVRVHHLSDIINDLSYSEFLIHGAAGADLADLIMLD